MFLINLILRPVQPKKEKFFPMKKLTAKLFNCALLVTLAVTAISHGQKPDEDNDDEIRQRIQFTQKMLLVDNLKLAWKSANAVKGLIELDGHGVGTELEMQSVTLRMECLGGDGFNVLKSDPALAVKRAEEGLRLSEIALPTSPEELEKYKKDYPEIYAQRILQIGRLNLLLTDALGHNSNGFLEPFMKSQANLMAAEHWAVSSELKAKTLVVMSSAFRGWGDMGIDNKKMYKKALDCANKAVALLETKTGNRILWARGRLNRGMAGALLNSVNGNNGINDAINLKPMKDVVYGCTLLVEQLDASSGLRADAQKMLHKVDIEQRREAVRFWSQLFSGGQGYDSSEGDRSKAWEEQYKRELMRDAGK